MIFFFLMTTRSKEQTAVFRGSLFREILVGWECLTKIYYRGMYLLLPINICQWRWLIDKPSGAPDLQNLIKSVLLLLKRFLLHKLWHAAYMLMEEEGPSLLRELKYAGGGEQGNSSPLTNAQSLLNFSLAVCSHLIPIKSIPFSLSKVLSGYE